MIGSIAHIRATFRIEQSVSDTAIQQSLSDANAILSEMVGTHYGDIDSLSATSADIAGGIMTDTAGNSHHFVGLAYGVECCAFALLMLSQDIVVTSFGVVRKRDEYSEHAEAFAHGKSNEAIFRTVVAHYCTFKGWPYFAPDSTAYTTRFFEKK